MIEVLGAVVLGIGLAFAGYSVLINGSFLLLTGLALVDLVAYRRRVDFAGYDEAFGDPNAAGVSILMPAYNESATIVASVQSMAALRYPDFEIVVVDDGSTDDTAAKLIAAFDMVAVPLVASGTIGTSGAVLDTWVSRGGSHNLVLLTKQNGGKADALNAGINHARKELVCMVDADSLLDADALLHVARPFTDRPGRVAATGGVVRVANGSRISGGRVVDARMPHRWLPRIQVVEYLRAFLVGRAGWSRIGGLLVISGAFGVFRKDLLFEVRGMAVHCIGEDAELVTRLHRHLGDHRRREEVLFVPEPVAWTEVPEERRVLRKQRRRWHRGLSEILWRHRSMLLRPRYGTIGMVTMPWFVLFELLAPVVEVLGLGYFAVASGLLVAEHLWWPGLDLVNLPVLLLLLTASVLFATLITLVSVLAEAVSFRRYRRVGDVWHAARGAVAENFGYRQLNAWWRLGGMTEAVRRTGHDWGDMRRRGFEGSDGG